jgi:hypothetical protein
MHVLQMGFLGFVNIAKLLTKLTEQMQSFQWTPEVEAAVQTLKGVLYTAPILAYPEAGEVVHCSNRRK